MFAFFLNENFFDFWANQPGDEFLDLTASKMGWDLSIVTLIHYSGIPVNRPEFFRFDENKNLIIQEKHITESVQTQIGENGVEETVIVKNESLVDVKTIESIKYVINGEKLIVC
jgi:hypothetical protein